MRALVTFSLGKDFEKVTQHDWHRKVAGLCPLAQLLGFSLNCSDVTGRHHTLMLNVPEGNSVAVMDLARHIAAKTGSMITRVEGIGDN